MTIATTTNTVTASGNGSTTVFAYDFYIPNAASVIVTYTDAGGVATQLLPSQFSISGLDSASGGSVTYPLAGSPIAAGTTLTITRTVPYTQPTALTSQGPYLPGAVEAALDNLEMQIQQLATSITSGVAGVASFNSRTGNVSLASVDVTTALGFTPLEPANNLSELTDATAARSHLGLGTIATEAAADYALLANPTFTGTPAAPTAADGTNTTQIATTAFVQSAISGSVAGVATFNTRTGDVTLSLADVTGALTYTPLNVAQNLADVGSPATARVNLGLGTIATQSAAAVDLTGGTIKGISELGDNANPILRAVFSDTVASGSVVLADFEIGISGASQDSGALRGFGSVIATATNAMVRGVESQATVHSGATLNGVFGLEVGLHSQVAGSGSQTIGIYCASSHTGWLLSGVQNDVGILVTGEDGWKQPYRYDDTTGTVKFAVDSAGTVFSAQRFYSSTTYNGGTKFGILVPSQAPSGETWYGLWYDSVKAIGKLEALTQGTSYRDVALCPSGGNVLIGTETDAFPSSLLQVAGLARFASNTAASAGGSIAAGIRLGDATGVGIYFGSGAPTVAAAKGSLYLRSDGSGTTNRAYINTDGGTTWTAITTAA